MVYVRRLKERQNVIKMFRVTHPHGFLVLEAPEPKGGCSQVIAEKYTLFCAIIVSSISDVRAPLADDLLHRSQTDDGHVEDHDRGSEAPIRRAFPTRYDHWHRASGHRCDTNEVRHQAKIGGAYSRAAETHAPCPYKLGGECTGTEQRICTERCTISLTARTQTFQAR